VFLLIKINILILFVCRQRKVDEQVAQVLYSSSPQLVNTNYEIDQF